MKISLRGSSIGKQLLHLFAAVCGVAMFASVAGSAQTLQYVPVISPYAGGATTVCTAHTDTFGDGCPATQAILSSPWNSVSDGAGNYYFSDEAHQVVRRIDAKTGIITLVAGGATTVCAGANTVGDGCPATQAKLDYPKGVAFDPFGNLVIADGLNQRIRSVNLQTGIITTIAGTGVTAKAVPDNSNPLPAGTTAVSTPTGVAFDDAGNLYISNGGISYICVIVATNGVIDPAHSLTYNLLGTGAATSTGDGGPSTAATASTPRGLRIDAAGNVFFSDYGGFSVRKITSPFQNGTLNIAGATVSKVAGIGTTGSSGDGGQATQAQLANAQDVAFDNTGKLYIQQSATTGDHVRVVDLTSGIINNYVGNGTRGSTGDNGPALTSEISGPTGVSFDRSNVLSVVAYTSNTIRRVSLDNNFLPQTIGTISASRNVIAQATQATTLQSAAITSTATPEFILGKLSGCTVGSALALNAYCTLPITFQPALPGLRSGRLTLTDNNAATATIGVTGVGVAPALSFSSSVISTVAGTGTAGNGGATGPAASAQVSAPRGGVVDGQGNIYFADSGNNTIRRIDAVTGAISTVAGSGASGSAGDGAAATAAQLKAPTDVAVDAAGNLYIADTGNNTIRFVDVNTGFISTIAGTGTAGYTGDAGQATAASLSSPQGLALDLGGGVYVADTGNNVIRFFARGGTITTLFGTGTAGYSGDGGPASSAALSAPTAVTLDQNGNIFIADKGNSVIREISPLGQMATVAGKQGGTSNQGDGGAATSATFASPSDVAVDAAGDLYIVSGGQVRLVDGNGAIRTVAGTGGTGAYSGEGAAGTNAVIPAPAMNVALDGAANPYIFDTVGNRILKVASATPRLLDFGSQTPNTTGASQTVTVLNVGNAALKFTDVEVTSSYALQTSDPAACTATTTLAPGTSCTLSIVFSPTATGTFTGTVTLTDNSLNATGAVQTIALTGVSKIVNVTTTSVTVTPASFTYGSAAVAKATLAGAVGATGNITFSVGGTTVGTAPLNANSASLTLPNLPAGSYSVTATYAGDANNASSSSAASFAVQPAVLTVTATNVSVAYNGAIPALTYTVTGLVNGDTISVVTGTPVETTTATNVSDSGTYPITIAQGSLATPNYTFNFVNGTVTVGPRPPADYTLTATPTTLTIVAGQVGAVVVTVTPLYGYKGTVQLSCDNFASNIACHFNTSTLTFDGTGTVMTTQLSVATDSLEHLASAEPAPPVRGRMQRALPAMALPIVSLSLLLMGFRKKRIDLRGILGVAMLTVLLGGMTACSATLGQKVAAIGTSQFTVSATDGSAKLSHSVGMSITVQ